jgi:hypothetical protein
MGWLTGTAFDAGQLEREIELRVRERIEQGVFTEEEIRNVAERKLDLIMDTDGRHGPLVSQIQTLARLWDLKPDVRRLDSYKPLIGPALGLVKRALFRIFRFMVLPAFEQQSEFNRTVVRMQKEQIKAILALDADVHRGLSRDDPSLVEKESSER